MGLSSAALNSNGLAIKQTPITNKFDKLIMKFRSIRIILL
jgi:hypothetical protein